MKKLMYLFFAVALLGLTMCQKEQIEQKEAVNDLKATQIGINNSTLSSVGTTWFYTSSLNGLTILIKYNVTASTLIYLNSRPANLSQLKPGFRVSVYYDINTGATVKVLAYGQ